MAYLIRAARHYPDQAASDESLRSWIEQWNTHGFGYWTVLLPESRQIIDFGGIRRFFWRDRDTLNLYYRFAPSAWGYGYAAEVATMAVTLAKRHLSRWPIVARVRAENVASIRTAERAGLLRRPDLDTEYLIYALGWEPA